MEISKIELDCPPAAQPKRLATRWIKDYGETGTYLIKMHKEQPTNGAHSHYCLRAYYYLFKDGECLLSHLPGMDRLFTENTFEHMIFRAKFKKFRPKRLQKILEVRDLIFYSKTEGE